MKQKEQVEEAYQDAAEAEGTVDDDAKIAEDEAGGVKSARDMYLILPCVFNFSRHLLPVLTLVTNMYSTGFGEVKKRLRTPGGGATGSVRNLRIREDTAKYLLNLDANSAHYDPKSRSMREDPQPNKPANEKTFQGDNFVRKGGDFAAWQTMQMHSLQAFDKGQDVHMQANPSLAEMLYKQFKEKKSVLEKEVTNSSQV